MTATVQLAALQQHFDRWSDIRLACRPADRRAAEQGIRLAYAAAGLAPPKRII
jgi:hypothetical protein